MKRYTLITLLMAIGVCPIAAQNIIVTSAEGQNVENFVRSIFLNPQPSAQTAFDEAMARYGEHATVIAMPFGGATLPMPPA